MPRVVKERSDVVPALAEVFREHGFEGASLSIIEERTGVGKGSLYHFFPGGKEEMATTVLAEIDEWFNANVFRPLKEQTDPHQAIEDMLRAVDAYFQSGRRVCLVGALALGDARDYFARQIRTYFRTWREALANALMRAGMTPADAKDMAEDVVGSIQGALVLARALDDLGSFRRAIARLQVRLQSAGKRCRTGGWRLDRRSRRLTDPQERPVALSKSEGKTKNSLLKGKKIDE
jgi:TetR/AcrR family transcriptional repressor of lmrAB and yxaGH operons